MAFTFYETNLIATNSMIWLSSGSGTSSNLYDRKEKFKWSTVGESSDATTATVSIVFPSATAISNMFLINHNLKGFKVTYDSTTSTLTPNLAVTTNTSSNTAFSFETTTVNSIEIHGWATHTANAEKFIGQLIISKGKKVELDTNPKASSYIPLQRHIGIERELIDGGTINIRNSTKFSANVSLDKINTQTFISLYSVWEANRPFLFVEFPSTFTASWNGIAKEVIWPGDFNARQFRQNKVSGGYRGSFILKQIPD